ncbi:MAG: TIR domain-containing protein [Candidatus Thiodiazotropha taylori]|nr:TIR domain-containing protein [Candidatus Thiodiazotropha taylori]
MQDNDKDKKFDIFLSYARSDQEKASRVVKGLEKVGYSVWWDQRMRPGGRFPAEIQQRLDDALAVVVLWSKVSEKSEWVEKEAVYADNHHKHIPATLDGVIPFMTVSKHTINLSGWRGDVNSSDFSDLLDAIKTTSGKAVAPSYVNADKEKTISAFAKYIFGAAILAALAASVSAYRSSNGAIDYNNIKTGIMLRHNWKVCEAKRVYSQHILNMNEFLNNSGYQNFRFSYDDIVTYTSYEKLKSDIDNGVINIAGELSPYQIYELNSSLGAVPFISPNYAGSDSYKAVFFTSKNYIQNISDDISSDWELIIKKIGKNNEVKVSLLDKSSTSGYWYPRFTLLQDIGGTNSFDEIALKQNNYESVYTSVENNYGGAILGAMAEFKHCKRGEHKNNYDLCIERFPIIQHTSAIPNGGFVMNRELSEYLQDKKISGQLYRAWKTSIGSIFSGKHSNADNQVPNDCVSGIIGSENLDVGKYIQNNWTRVNVENYRAAFDVFQFSTD